MALICRTRFFQRSLLNYIQKGEKIRPIHIVISTTVRSNNNLKKQEIKNRNFNSNTSNVKPQNEALHIIGQKKLDSSKQIVTLALFGNLTITVAKFAVWIYTGIEILYDPKTKKLLYLNRIICDVIRSYTFPC